jgi:hypothetical protein
MKVSEYFDSRKRESQKLVEELAQHEAGWPAVLAQYNAIDGECVTLAGKLAAARTAQSPTAYELEGQLKQVRWKRDGLKRDHQLRRDELHRAISIFTGPAIHKFRELCLQKIAGLAELYRFEQLTSARSSDGRRLQNTVKIQHNQAALNAARDKILAAMREAEAMQYFSLGDLEQCIVEFRKTFDAFDLDSLEIISVSEERLAEMKPENRNPAGSGNVAHVFSDGSTHVFENPAASAQIARLGDRLEKLEKQK